MGMNIVPRMTSALYVRVSTTKQDADNQLIQLREYCKNSQIDVFREYTDIVSGKEKYRPSYDEMFRDAHQRKFRMVLFWDLSRFSRAGTLHTLQKLHELDSLGIVWRSYNEPYLDSTGVFKDVVISIMASLAKIEREKISERTKAGLVRAENVGKRGKDKKPRKWRNDKGIKRGGVTQPHTPLLFTSN